MAELSKAELIADIFGEDSDEEEVSAPAGPAVVDDDAPVDDGSSHGDVGPRPSIERLGIHVLSTVVLGLVHLGLVHRWRLDARCSLDGMQTVRFRRGGCRTRGAGGRR